MWAPEGGVFEGADDDEEGAHAWAGRCERECERELLWERGREGGKEDKVDDDVPIAETKIGRAHV